MPNNRIPLIVSGGLILLSIIILVFFILLGVNKPQNAIHSKADTTDSNLCQGNPNASAKCFDCLKDATGSADQINVLDFSCFAKYYGQTVGKP